MPFDLSMTKLLILGVIAMLVFGPDKLPQVARDAGRMVRQLRGLAQQARSDLKSELGDTVGDFDFEDLNPRTFVRKHLLDDSNDVRPAAPVTPAVTPAGTTVVAAAAAPTGLGPGEPVPFDPDAT
jgi:sec-independent protein translocase protein TatB